MRAGHGSSGRAGQLVPAERPEASNLGQCGQWEHGPEVARCSDFSGESINPDFR